MSKKINKLKEINEVIDIMLSKLEVRIFVEKIPISDNNIMQVHSSSSLTQIKK